MASRQICFCSGHLCLLPGVISPVRERAPKIVELLLTFATGPSLALALERRSAPQLVFSDIGAVATQTGVIVELRPGDRVVMTAKSQKAAENYIGIDDAPAHLFDHETLDGADVLALEVVHGGALNPITLDNGLGHGWAAFIPEGEPILSDRSIDRRFA